MKFIIGESMSDKQWSFGQKNFMMENHVNRLPERLPMLYAGLTR